MHREFRSTDNRDELKRAYCFTKLLNILKTIPPKRLVRDRLESNKKTGKAMSITFRVVMILFCAYAGWETANFQLQQLPESEQLTQEVVLDSNRLNLQ